MGTVDIIIIVILCLVVGILIRESLLFRIIISRTVSLEKDKPKKVSLKKSTEHDASIKKLIFQLKNSLNATKVIVARFHNGGNFANGYDMRKFTVTHETDGGSIAPMMDGNAAVLMSRYPDPMLTLVTMGSYIVHDVNDCCDYNFRKDMAIYGFKSTHLFLIEQVDGTEEGFIGVNFDRTRVLTQEEKHKIEDKIPWILSELNMIHSE